MTSNGVEPSIPTARLSAVELSNVSPFIIHSHSDSPNQTLHPTSLVSSSMFGRPYCSMVSFLLVIPTTRSRQAASHLETTALENHRQSQAGTAEPQEYKNISFIKLQSVVSRDQPMNIPIRYYASYAVRTSDPYHK
jgi:hypothetical protein